MKKTMEYIKKILSENNIEFDEDGNYINIKNSSTMTRIIFKNFIRGTIGTETAVYVEEFDELGRTIYHKEFVEFGKRFVNRVSKNIG